MKKIFLIGLLVFTFNSYASMNGSQASTESLNLSGTGSGQIIGGSVNLLQAGSQVPIVALKVVGDFAYLTLKVAGASTHVTIKVASSIVGFTLIGSGQFLQVATVASGTILTSAGKIVAFIPNQLGKTLLYSAAI